MGQVGRWCSCLDAIEPLSQEIDHPGITDGLPVERGALHLWLLSAPALWLVPFVLLGAGVIAAVEPHAAGAAFVLAIPVTWVGASGSVVNAVRDASPTVVADSVLVPPEFAGFGNAIKVLAPVVVSALAAVPVLLVRERPDVCRPHGDPGGPRGRGPRAGGCSDATDGE